MEQLIIKLRRYGDEVELECFVKVGRGSPGRPARFADPAGAVAWVADKLRVGGEAAAPAKKEKKKPPITFAEDD